MCIFSAHVTEVGDTHIIIGPLNNNRIRIIYISSVVTEKETTMILPVNGKNIELVNNQQIKNEAYNMLINNFSDIELEYQLIKKYYRYEFITATIKSGTNKIFICYEFSPINSNPDHDYTIIPTFSNYKKNPEWNYYVIIINGYLKDAKDTDYNVDKNQVLKDFKLLFPPEWQTCSNIIIKKIGNEHPNIDLACAFKKVLDNIDNNYEMKVILRTEIKNNDNSSKDYLKYTTSSEPIKFPVANNINITKFDETICDINKELQDRTSTILEALLKPTNTPDVEYQ